MRVRRLKARPGALRVLCALSGCLLVLELVLK
jgi:hypothetical protein